MGENNLWSVGELSNVVSGCGELETLQGGQVPLSSNTSRPSLGLEVGVDLGGLAGTESGVDVVLVNDDPGALNDVLLVWVADLEVDWVGSWCSEDSWECRCQCGKLDEVRNHDELETEKTEAREKTGRRLDRLMNEDDLR